eukprot:TRINITY_DN1409_c0_g1_i4.p1 TRINITY_DN1409_c0_g1~~TRINITY_DN1409_c0_g1_i4.p1  ORF type:complete len:116 (-),score=10.38 TRINITY_DN1409_c0_g1_i4:81-428(-)
MGYKLALLLFGCFVSFRTRKVTHKRFKEATNIGVAIYNMSFVFIILVPLVIVLDSVEAEFLLISLGIIFSTTVALSATVVPKLYLMNDAGEIANQKSSQSKSNQKRQEEVGLTPN